ncbi:MAG: acyl-ACP--UDP-N-acetylglucosamine O-acyltransferase [Prevotella sp.]|nr:acyl-ACP--UDP-N-acetylglucosamine O-acyltransferase [Prevotella sp.]
MASEISPKAEVSPKAKIGNNCKIFPFVYIEDDVEIGDNCIIFPFVSICDGSRIGNGNKIHQGSVISALPQDFNFRGAKSYVVIGDNNVIRENVVINRGTQRDGKTVIGNNNFLLEGTHISHDTKVGDHCVFGYGVKIAGDCEIDNGAIFSSSAIQNANTRVGRLALVQAGCTFSKDVPPFIVAGGKPLSYSGPNTTMMNEAGINPKVQKHIANAYRLLFHGKTSVFDVINQIKDQVPDGPEIRTIIQFLEGTRRGIMGK